MSRRREHPKGLPTVATPIKPADGKRQTAEEVAATLEEATLQVEEEKYQTEQEIVNVMVATCPRCGSADRSRLKVISPRIPTSRGLLIRYRTTCRGRINPVDKEGKPVVDVDGKPVSYECGNRYRVHTLVPNVRQKDRKSDS